MVNKKSGKVAFAFIVTLLGLCTGKPAFALGEYWSGGFSTVNSYRWIYSNMTSTYANTYVIPAAGSQWNGISSQVSLTRVTSGTYIVNAQLATGTDPNVTGLMTPYCSAGSGSVCLNTTWTSASIIGYENVMASANYNTTERISTFTHEFGHSLSLTHVTNGSAAVMRPAPGSLGVQAYDKANLKAKWGN